MPRRFRDWVESVLPWYHPETETERDERSAKAAARSEAALKRAKRVIAEAHRSDELFRK